MKKIIISAICLALVLPMFNSCKKGENDPMSLKSRKARLTGEWELVEAEGTEMYNGIVSSFTYNGSTWTTVTLGDVNTRTWSQTLEILKDGTYEMKTSGISSDVYSGFATWTYSSSGTGSGGWSWLGKSKEKEFKNKERFGLEEMSSTSTTSTSVDYDGSTVNDSTYSSTTIHTFDGDDDITVYRIDQLKNKEMIIVEEYSEMSGTNVSTFSATYTYEKQ